MRLRTTAFRDPAAYFHQYASLSPEAARARALDIWRSINLKNLEENILPTRQRARLILRKEADHHVDRSRCASSRSFDKRAEKKKAAWGGGPTSNAL